MNTHDFRLIAPPHTPLHADGSLHLDPVADQARHFEETGVSGVFVAGSTGEGHSLTLEERLLLAERWIDVARSTSLEVIVQVGSNCQLDACRMAAHAQQTGADAVAAQAPCYFKPETVPQLIDFCVPIAAAAGDLPFYYYDIPGLTGVRLPMAEFLAAGKSRIPNLAGIKYSNPDLVQLQECVRLDDGMFDVLFGCDEALLGGYALGARGAVGTTYNFAAPLYQHMIERFQAGDLEAARDAQAKSVEMVRTMRQFGFPAAAKAVMAMLGIDCGPVRPPLENLTAPQRQALHQQLESLDLFRRPLQVT